MDSLDVLRRLVSPLASVRGLRRVNEHLRRRYSNAEETRLISDFDGDIRFACRLDSHISSTIYWAGCYSASQLRLLDRILRADMTFVDAGANEGEQTLFAAKRLRAGKVIAFEPNPQIFAMLEKNLALNGFGNTKLEQLGLGDQAGEVSLFASDSRSADGSFNLGLSTLHAREGVSTSVASIRVDTLDNYCAREGLKRLDVLKIDVEGSELAALRGAVRTLEALKPRLIIEVNETTSRAGGYEAREILEFISAQGYAVHNILADGSTRKLTDLRYASRDVYCVPTGGALS